MFDPKIPFSVNCHAESLAPPVPEPLPEPFSQALLTPPPEPPLPIDPASPPLPTTEMRFAPR